MIHKHLENFYYFYKKSAVKSLILFILTAREVKDLWCVLNIVTPDVVSVLLVH